MANAWYTKDIRVTVPEAARFVLTGLLPHGVCAKDVMLHILSQPFFKTGQGIGKVLEFAGDGVEAMPLDERATLTNMAVEAGGFTAFSTGGETLRTSSARTPLLAFDAAREDRAVRDSFAGRVARDQLGCRFFDFLSGIDWMPSPFGRYEDAEIGTAEGLAAKVQAAMATERETGLAGGDTRFQVFAHVIDTTERHDVFLKVDVPEPALSLPTWSRLYAGANWHERECWEMFGITFEGNPDQRHIYLPTEFEGHPLRKEFPLLARVVKPWPGIVDVEPMPGGDDEEAEGEGGEDA